MGEVAVRATLGPVDRGRASGGSGGFFVEGLRPPRPRLGIVPDCLVHAVTGSRCSYSSRSVRSGLAPGVRSRDGRKAKLGPTFGGSDLPEVHFSFPTHTSSQKLAMSKISVSISSYPGNDIDNMCHLQSGTSTTSVTLLSILSAAVQLSRAELGPRHFRSSIAPGTVNGAMS
jgi:hypothetical protein